MTVSEILAAAAAALGLVAVVLLAVVLYKVSKSGEAARRENLRLRQEHAEGERRSRSEMYDRFDSMSKMLASSSRSSFERQDSRLDALTKGVSDSLRSIDERFKNFSLTSEQKLDNMRTTMENRLASLQDDNNKKLERMRETVDEKLQKTLEDKIGHSFKLVSERLEQVYKGLGEMQTLASGVGDLKRVLGNVKTRGILGEIQLGSILEQILSPEQYEREIVTKQGSRDRVEYAVKMPGNGGSVYLPIDAKFPYDAYADLVDAYDRGEPDVIKACRSILVSRLKNAAKDIHDKYIDPPHTTDFAILFLPIEGLYAEAVSLGMVEVLQRDYKVNIAGPTTTAALLNSLQMGFRTLAIQKRSGEVWKVLGEVKAEFDNFAGVLSATQQRLNQANAELDKLVGVRTRQIQKRLKDVTALPEADDMPEIGESSQRDF